MFFFPRGITKETAQEEKDKKKKITPTALKKKNKEKIIR